ncbi:hypothetical protein HOLleu_26122 [Holothuria leucospilota]|uniref:Uncharacterized protein n=1 Tax=Holothuria leucospilota TaxID=206669 RepID=A0A9Q1BTG5_HOLLE|nr:hypothetical protein HOLleu_26122 [Holothuria leucospilota]
MKYDVLLVLVAALFVTLGWAGSGGPGCSGATGKRSIEGSIEDTVIDSRLLPEHDGTLSCYQCTDCNATAAYQPCAFKCPTVTTACYKEFSPPEYVVKRGCWTTTIPTDTCQGQKPVCRYFCTEDNCNGGENLTQFPFVMSVLATLHIVLMKMLN